MSVKPTVIFAAVLALAGSPASAATLTEAWKVTGLDLPESVAWDANAKAFYVSNLGTDPMSKDGNGFVSRIGADGKVETLKWVTGLNAPKSGEVVGDKLYVTDIDELVEIDIPGGKVANRYKAEGAKFLNDIAVAADGRIFIADTFGNAIYLFQDGKVGEWVRGGKLVGPNGLVIIGSDLIVAELGDASQGFDKLKPGNVKKIDLTSKTVDDFGTPDAIGGLDGIEIAGDGGVYVTDNPGGRLLKVMPGKPAEEVAKLKPGAADFEFVPAENLFVIPQMQESEVVAYKSGG
jgi:DNA-binding beta-propeller fold protein YncE